MGNKRTIITISDPDKLWLESYSKANGISMAEAIRRGIARLRENEEDHLYRSILRKTKGIWNRGDGLHYQQCEREEWE